MYECTDGCMGGRMEGRMDVMLCSYVAHPPLAKNLCIDTSPLKSLTNQQKSHPSLNLPSYSPLLHNVVALSTLATSTCVVVLPRKPPIKPKGM